MKALIIVLCLFSQLVMSNAYAGAWILVHQEFVMSTGWICTYKLQGSNYQATIISDTMCQQFIFQRGIKQRRQKVGLQSVARSTPSA